MCTQKPFECDTEFSQAECNYIESRNAERQSLLVFWVRIPQS